ncbi:MAG: HEAT repeat domain-containing protein, partial [Planctomycetaceae bacterium]
RQRPDGSWVTHTGPENATSFAILFMVKSTGKLLARPPVGGGLLSGGRGLPEDLSGANVAGGTVAEKRKPEGPLDELLAQLSSTDISILEGAQQAIVEKVQIGDRNELLKEMDRVRKLADHPNVEVRRTAVWALGRSRDLRDAGLLIRALQDPNYWVAVEANNGLSYLSRKLSGVGVDSDPHASLPESATEKQQEDAFQKWQKDALSGWSKWYLRVRPYEDRNDSFELRLRNAVEKK